MSQFEGFFASFTYTFIMTTIITFFMSCFILLNAGFSHIKLKSTEMNELITLESSSNVFKQKLVDFVALHNKLIGYH